MQTVANPPNASTGNRRGRTILFVLCVVAGAAPFASRWIQTEWAALSYLLVLSAFFFAAALYARRNPRLSRYWELPFVFFILSLVQLLNALVPWFRTTVLHEVPVPGNPLGSTVLGTVVIQLLETLIAVGTIFVLTKASGKSLSEVYARTGRLGWLFVLSSLMFVAIAFVMARHGSRFIPARGAFTLDRYLALAPALFVLVVSNGFQEEFLFRGLFLKKYQTFFNVPVSIVLQAIVFSIAHLGVGYTTSAALFIVSFVFPLGLIGGYLMHATKGVVTPAIFHAALDIPIYLAFLSYVA